MAAYRGAAIGRLHHSAANSGRLTCAAKAAARCRLHGLPSVVPVFGEAVDHGQLAGVLLPLLSGTRSTDHELVPHVAPTHKQKNKAERHQNKRSEYRSSHSLGFSHWETSVLQL